MKKQTKVRVLAFLLVLGISVSGFAISLEDLQEGVNDFSEHLALSLPLNSSLGLNWADAYIGKIFPSLPPHFGIGGSFGITTMDLPTMKTLMNYFGYSFPFDIKRMFFPAYAAEARIGGFFLPFDIGAKFGYLQNVGMWGSSLDMNYLLIGADFRYALVDLKLIRFSLGVGVNYLKGGIQARGSTQTFNHDHGSIEVADPKIDLHWQTTSLDFRAQLSFSLVLLTPYLGIAGSCGWSSAGYSVGAAITPTIGGFEDIEESIDISDTGISSTVKTNAFSFRAFGGLSLNFIVFKVDFTAIYSFRDQNFGSSIGFRLQL